MVLLEQRDCLLQRAGCGGLQEDRGGKEGEGSHAAPGTLPPPAHQRRGLRAGGWFGGGGEQDSIGQPACFCLWVAGRRWWWGRGGQRAPVSKQAGSSSLTSLLAGQACKGLQLASALQVAGGAADEALGRGAAGEVACSRGDRERGCGVVMCGWVGNGPMLD